MENFIQNFDFNYVSSLAKENPYAFGAGIAASGLIITYNTSRFFKTLTQIGFRLLRQKIGGKSTEEQCLIKVLEESKKNNPQSVLSVIDDFCNNGGWMMNVGDKKKAQIDKILKETKPKRILELGTYCGYSAVMFAQHVSQGGKVFSIDINHATTAYASMIAQQAGLADRIEFMLGGFAKNVDSIKEQCKGEKLDVILIDHFKDYYLEDLHRLEESGLIQKGTVIIADNVLFPGAPDYSKYVYKRTDKYKTTRYESIIPGMEKKDALDVSIAL